MDWVQIANIGTTIGAAVFLVAFTVYSSLLYTARGHHVKRFQSILLHSMFVSGLTACTYIWILGSGPSSVRWISYSLCSPVLVLTTYELLADHNPGKSYPLLVWAAVVSTFVTVVSGYFIAAPGLTFLQRLIPYIGAFIPFVMLMLFLNRAIKRKSTAEFWWSPPFFFKLFWLAYPIFYALEPHFFDTITGAQAQFGYLLADMVTKLAYDIYACVIAYRACGRLRRYRKRDETSSSDFAGKRGMSVML